MTSKTSKITRRDFVNGSLVVAGSLLATGCGHDHDGRLKAIGDSPPPSPYPPGLTGLRGNHPGSYECAHEVAWAGKSGWGEVVELDEQYDLIVVGGGISGLSAACFFRQLHGADKKVLIIENHDDFGGHARRNEHQSGGKTVLTYGGSQSLVSPHTWSPVVKGLMDHLGVDIERFRTAYDSGFFKRNNLKAVTFFNKKVYGRDALVPHPFCNYPWWVEGLPRPVISDQAAVDATPLSGEGKRQLLNLMRGGVHTLGVPKDRIADYISTRSYLDYLKHMGIDDPGVIRMARNSCSDWAGGGAEVLTIEEAMDCGALGLDPLAARDLTGHEAWQKSVREYGNIFDPGDPYIYHFPDGNATIARMLVRQMIPRVGAGEKAEQIVLSRFDYGQLDRPDNPVRLRLNSTAVNVTHEGDPATARQVRVTYVQQGRARMVRGSNVVMACYNNMIPSLVTGLPEEQVAALRRINKIPLQYTTIGLRNWQGIKDAGIGLVFSPGNHHQIAMMDFPVSIGGYRYPGTPDDPAALVLIGCPVGSRIGTPPIEQFREARMKMLAMRFEDYENELRQHLAGMLPSRAFDFDRDVESITVNRWAHGYVYSGSALFDADLPEKARAGRQPFGRVAIANIDSGLSSYLHVAVQQAWRAVNELPG